MAKKRSKSTITPCQSKAEVMENITKIGLKQREISRLEAEMNDKITQLTEQYKDDILKLQVDVETLTHQAQIWCEQNRNSLLEDKGKTANLLTGEVSWRFRPAKVTLSKESEIIEQLEQQGLTHFVRVKKNVNKEAILADPMAVKNIVGIHIVSNIEDFIITPFELNID